MEVLCLCALNMFSFVLGAKIGQKVVNKEEINVLPNPAEVIREHQAKVELSREEERNKIIMENIDAYDGTGIGQKDIPKAKSR